MATTDRRNDGLSRRQALAGMGAGMGLLGAAAVGGGAGRARAATAAWSWVSPAQLGWDEGKGEYVLPKLPFAPEALEPHIDAETMRIHHGKHHAGYVTGLNRALKMLQDIRENKGDPGTLQHWQRQLAFHGGGHVNHALFWASMAPEGAGGGGEPGGGLRAAIDRDFGSFDTFAWSFRMAANAVEGSGWGYLVFEPLSARLLVMQMQSQQDMLFAGVVPLLGVDVWEHAYYLKYQNRRSEYTEAFLRVVNWSEVARRYGAAVGG